MLWERSQNDRNPRMVVNSVQQVQLDLSTLIEQNESKRAERLLSRGWRWWWGVGGGGH